MAPILLVAVLFGFSVAAEDDATELDPDPVAHIDVIGFQWSWQFVYTDEDITITGEPGEPPEMVVPVGQPVELRLVSADVNHSFWVPDFLSKRDLIPGVDNEISITPDRDRQLRGPLRRVLRPRPLAHELHGAGRVRADEYEAWLDDQQAGGDETAGGGG